MKDLFDIKDKVVVLTGGNGLLGKTIAKELDDRGARGIIVDIKGSFPVDIPYKNVIGFSCDVSKSNEVLKLKDEIMNMYGKIDVLINNHQCIIKGLSTTPETFPEDVWDEILGVNLKGTFLTCKEFGSVMVEQKYGSIINFGSTYGLVSSNPNLYEDKSFGNPLAYSVSKGGVHMLTKYLGVHWADRGVRVNEIVPHGVENNHKSGFVGRFSNMSPMKRLMRPDEILGAILFLASDASSYMTGSTLEVNGGWTNW